MSNNIVLTIAIPTFNRRKSLETTIQSLVPLCGLSEVQILVIDNCSNDGTWEWICRKKEEFKITIVQNPTNFGIEGNIIQGLFKATGDYIWVLSDHMKINVSEVITFVEKLKFGLKFTFGYARIEQYSNVLPETYKPIKIGEMSQCSIGEIIFFVGNISAFIVNRQFLNQHARTVYRFAGTSYPQLGVFVHADKNTTLIELATVSSFSSSGTEPKRISYDTFRSRFIGFVRAIDEIRRLNPNLKKINKALKTGALIRALAFDAMSNLCFATINPVKPSEYAFCFTRYPGVIRLFLWVCLMLSALPEKLRLTTSRAFFGTLFPKYYSMAEEAYKQRYSSELFKE